MRRQPIPDPLECLDTHTRIDAICNVLESEILSGTYNPITPVRLLSEKSKGLCRQIVIPAARDALVLQLLADTLWAEIKAKAPTKKSFYAPADNQFSKVIKGHSNEYGSINAWLAFQEAIFGFAAKKPFVVVTDIANYYDTISYDHLRNILADLSLQREHALDLLIYALSCMLWQPDYMPRVPVGLPQSNLDAPRLLAHAFLFEIDEMLSARKGVDFARFMDDIDIGVDTLNEARSVLRDLDLALQTRQVRLNSGKTKILPEVDAFKHFRIRENLLIDSLTNMIDIKRAAKIPLDAERRKIGLAIRSGYRFKRSADGNGDKILKRLINLARQLHVDIPDELFFDLLCNSPSLRQTLLLWWQSRIAPESKLPLIERVVREGNLVDDASKLEIAMALVTARLPNDANTVKSIANIAGLLNNKLQWDFYAKAWILSKYGSTASLMALVETSVSTWRKTEPLSRLVAGLFPRFLGTPLQSKFENILARDGNAWSATVLQFHHTLIGTSSGYVSIKSFLLAKNGSLPNQVSHAKFLMLLSVFNGSHVFATVKHLKSSHIFALSDPWYATLTS